MKRTAIHLAIVCFFALSFAQVASTQQVANVAGKWDVTVRMPDRTVSEQWTVRQDGDKITGTLKGAGGELPVTGEVNAVVFRVTFKVGDTECKVIATVDDDVMDGSLLIGKTQYLWSAKRSKS